ncbi:hypothetical protein [Sunxiuqinia sp. sy24]|uniref:hypothetical protein n=1 Tax=Sunxiuqinia sp. sy24 TaxID=3461495 RepID=UPI0040462FFD
MAQENLEESLFLEVSEHNAGDIQLCRKIGFLLTGERKKDYTDGSDALVMSAELSSLAED